MTPKILTSKDYLECFSFFDTDCGILQDNQEENYLAIETEFPIAFLNFENRLSLLDTLHLNRLLGKNIPNNIAYKFELFGIGNIDLTEAFIFKPWVLNIDNFSAYRFFESFNLFIPQKLFYHFIGGILFSDRITIDTFKSVRVLQDIPLINFKRFGLDRENVKFSFKTQRLRINRIDSNTDYYIDIFDFYKANYIELTIRFQLNYFTENNIWFKINLNSTNETIGYFRLYYLTNKYNGTIYVEYVISKNFRKLGYATEALQGIVEYLKKYSYAFFVVAEVNELNQDSINALVKNMFTINSNINIHSFELDLMNYIKHDEINYKNNPPDFYIDTKYATKFSRYL